MAKAHPSLSFSPSNYGLLATIPTNATIVDALSHIYHTGRSDLQSYGKSFPLNDCNFVWRSWLSCTTLRHIESLWFPHLHSGNNCLHFLVLEEVWNEVACRLRHLPRRLAYNWSSSLGPRPGGDPPLLGYLA